MASQTSLEPSLAKSIVDQIELLVRDAEQSSRPLELDPYRARLFEVFVMAEAADLVHEGNARGRAADGKEADTADPHDLTADGLCRLLAERWQLADATRDSISNKTRLPAEHLARMRLLWSVMRMWMEWTYAWQRWAEFHRDKETKRPTAD